MEKLKFNVERIIFQNKENGYTVMQVSIEDSYDYHTVVGAFIDIAEGAVINANGEWRNDKKYGKQFVVDTWTEEMPVTVIGIRNYLSSGLISGIGPKKAKMIVRQFGEETIRILDRTPDRLLEVPGIGISCLEKIKGSWLKQKAIKDVMVFLQGYGVSATYAAKIYKEYGKESIEKVKENPYCLADDVFGIGFKMADSVAERMGYTKNDPRRCRAGIAYTLTQLALDGHCYAEKGQLVKAALELLGAEYEKIVSAIDDMMKDESVVVEDTAIYLPMYYYAEVGVAGKLKSLLQSGNILDETFSIEKISEQTNITYDDVQVDAIKQALMAKVMVLTGGPGTGKTTTTLGIITALEQKGLSIVCAAPTGRAAKRMSEATGKEAKTIHRLLEFKPQDGFSRNEDNPLSGDVLVIDESSMIDIILMNSLLKAVPKKMRVILVGDIDQLPSVGAGNILRDIINSGVVPVVTLTRIFRQALTSKIVTNAHKINHGEMPDCSNNREGDFFFIENDNPEQVAGEVVNIVKNRIPKAYGNSTNDIQVLVPMRRSVVGTVNLNNVLQDALNPIGESIQVGMNTFRIGDRVMQIKNNYDKDVFNGDVGMITFVDSEEGTLSVMFEGRQVDYERADLRDLTLAYACTIHKSQGSEYPVVVMPLMMSHYIMLQRNLVYTGVTRAKKLCIVIGDKKALAHAVRNMVVTKRNTRLDERLKK